jgi:phosphate transport system protein
VQTARRKFHEELAGLEGELLRLGRLSESAVVKAMDALVRKDAGLADQVVAADDVVDATYLDIEQRILGLLATQTPVASDLRLISAIMHANLHLERVGDQAVNIAKLAKLTIDLPASDTVVAQLREMGDLVGTMLRSAMDAFARRDATLAEQLQTMDEPVDRLNRNMYREVVDMANDPQALEWGIRMDLVSRQLERVGDHAVDIGELVAFLITGQFREFTDASHPVMASHDEIVS